MLRVNKMAMLTLGMLCWAPVFANDPHSSGTESDQTQVETVSVVTVLAESRYPARWRLFYPPEANVHSDYGSRPMADLEFQDRDALSRVSKVRRLSFLTLAEIGQTRLFLGVNEDGLVGLHINLFSRRDRERHLEFVRMPYLEKSSQPAD